MNYLIKHHKFNINKLYGCNFRSKYWNDKKMGGIKKLVGTKYNNDEYIEKNDGDVLNTLYDYLS